MARAVPKAEHTGLLDSIDDVTQNVDLYKRDV